MKVLVTGIAGFLARHVAAELEANGHQVLGFDARPSETGETVVGDLLDLAAVESAVGQVDCVCHLAGVGDVYHAFRDPPNAAAANVVGSANIVEAALRQGRKRVVYTSTWEVYGKPLRQPIDEQHPTNPDHPYNITKLAGERIVLAYDHLKDVPTIALRIGTAFGAGMRPNSVFSVFIGRARAGEPIAIEGTGAQTRQFTHARDIARAFRLAAESDARGMALNVVTEEQTSIRRLAELVIAKLPTTIEQRPARVGDIAPAVVSSALAKEVLGWQARVGFQDGLTELLAASG